MAKSITIKDIAREAGVSIALVSFVMNNRVEADGKQKYRVSEATKEKILEVARKFNYQPSSAARMLRQGRTHVIGVILSDLGNIFYGIIAKELEKKAHQHGYTVLFGSTEEDPERFDRLVRSFMEKDVEGFIVVPCVGSDAAVERLSKSGRPFVVMDRYHPDFDVPSVLVDNVEVMNLALDALQGQGARNIAMVSYAMRISSMTDREKSFIARLGDEAPIYRFAFDTVDQDAEKAADDIIARGIDGLITASNVPCVAIVKALIRRGIHIQKDIRIVGFDYSNIYDVFNPPITYVLQPLKEISHEAAEYLFRLIDMQEKGEDIRPVKDKIILKATLQ